MEENSSARSILSRASRNGAVAGVVMQKNTAAPAEVCPLCGGTGWKTAVSQNERKVARCDCFLQAQSGRLLEASGIPTRYAKCDFSSYQTENSTALGAAKITVENWANQYPIDRTGLLLVGPSGVGKTHLGVAALRFLASQGVHCLFCDYRELLKRIQNSYNPTVQATELDVLKPVFEAEVLVLDELGAV